LPPSQAVPSSSGVTATGEKAEDGEFGRDQAAQRNIVDQHHQPDRGCRLLAGCAHGHIADDHGDLAFQIDAVFRARHRDRITRPQEAVRAALIHQRVGPEARRHLCPARLANQLDVIDVGRAVGPLVGARQRRRTVMLMKTEGWHRAVLELLGEIGELRPDAHPVIQRRLQRGRDDKGVRGVRQVRRDDDQAAVAAMLERGEFHGVSASCANESSAAD
jgi:hypothetical protein